MRTIIVVLLSILFCQKLPAQARLVIKNDSERNLSVKVMRSGSSPVLHDTLSVAPKGEATMLFAQTGSYFAKSMATSENKDSVYQKTRSFRVMSGPKGYSVHTLTFSIKESSEAATGNIRISRNEYEKN